MGLFADSLGRECSVCLEYKHYSEYHRHKGCKFGFNTVCKYCRRSVSKTNYNSVTLESRILDRAKSRATRKGLDFNLELSDIVVPDVCPVFGTAFSVGNNDTAASIDRIDCSKGYIKGNIQIISNKANRMKSNGSLEDIEKLLKFLKGSCEI